MNEDSIDIGINGATIHAHTACRVPLRISVDQQHATVCGDIGGKVDGGCRFSDSAFLIDDSPA
jgi:hypothetical protein